MWPLHHYALFPLPRPRPLPHSPTHVILFHALHQHLDIFFGYGHHPDPGSRQGSLVCTAALSLMDLIKNYLVRVPLGQEGRPLVAVANV